MATDTLTFTLRLTWWPPRRVQRAFAAWADRTFPRVTTVPGRGRGGKQLRVDRAEFEAAILRAELSERPLAA